MGELGGFLRMGRAPANEREASERVRDYGEIFFVPPPEPVAQEGARCMDCGVPFCHAACPLGNPTPSSTT